MTEYDFIRSKMDDPFDLKRFVEAQNPVIGQVRAELERGRKEGHWMWFVFPQLKGLGQSLLAQKFGIASRAEAGAYLEHAILGPRLIECTRLVNALKGRTLEQIFGYPDTLKFRSSMTLFAEVSLERDIFVAALDKYGAGQFDQWTVDRL